ncbi:HalOD1 output domain-containing protein [Haloarculaceae archaeon H-GB2-1]|nr:hypothetical protein [Haloarculaceae archaeon H-GB1-1]MEA5389544.1 HalOD1 output domain-containing protein [Haloarculaceae archaeon H-GB11]MEA5410001.1 HalOD1 output domain-containing protein [Haloarculaceae archaeon H-GB2-1]
MRVTGDGRSEPTSLRVVTAIADATGKSPTAIEPLYSAVDPDALDELFGGGTSDRAPFGGTLTFTLEGCDVVVRADGTVDVTPVNPKDEAEVAE